MNPFRNNATLPGSRNETGRMIDTIMEAYIQKDRRYYNHLDKKHKLIQEEENLLDRSNEDIHQYCILDDSAEKELNLKKACQQFRGAENELIRIKYGDGEYNLENELYERL